MDKFLKLLTETHSLPIDKNTQKTRPAALPVRNPKDSILTSHPNYSIKKHDRIMINEVKDRGCWRLKKLKIMPKNKLGRRVQCIGEFTLMGAVDILMATATTVEKLSEVQKRGEYQIKKIKLRSKKSGNRLERVGEFTGNEAVDVLKAIGTTGGINETRKEDLRWKRARRYYQSKPADLRVYVQ